MRSSWAAWDARSGIVRGRQGHHGVVVFVFAQVRVYIRICLRFWS